MGTKHILEAAERFSKEFQSKVDIEPIPSHRHLVGSTQEDIDAGVQAIAKGEVAVVCLAGGQASRLGSKVPKGTFPLPIEPSTSLPEDKRTLFYLQALSINNLYENVKKIAGNEVKNIPWIIMTSESTEEATKKFFDEHLKSQFERIQIQFFQQPEIPCFDLNGDVIQNNSKDMTAPNGNGGFYEAIRDLLPELRERGVKYFHVYCVDNILCHVGDPGFIGKCVLNKADCAAKVVEKADPQEKIGIIGAENKKKPQLLDVIPSDVIDKYNALEEDSQLKNKSVSVIEYSEISKEQAQKRDPSNPEKLYFRAGNIAMHFFHIDFLSYVCHIKLPYHIARKQIKHVVNGKQVITPGTKLERFIFDVFPYSRNFLAYEVKRDEEFAPLKNSDADGVDCPVSCAKSLQAYHEKYCNDGIKKCALCLMKEKLSDVP